jgi:hypothetical protein
MSLRMAIGAFLVALLALAPGAFADPGNLTPDAAMATAQACVGVDPGPPPSLVGSCWNAALTFGGEVLLPPEVVVTLRECYNIDYGPPPGIWWGPCENAVLNLTANPLPLP